PQGSFPQREKIVGIEKGKVGLRLRACGGVYAPKGLDLVIVADVSAATHRRWRRQPELCGVFQSKGSDGTQPRRRHRREGRWCGTPFAGSGAAREDLRSCGEALVTGAQVEDVCGGLLTYEQARVPLQTEAVQVVVEKGV